MKKYGLIGRSLGHSFSKSFFEQRFIEWGIEASYENIELQDIDEVQGILKENYSGLNVTIPYKEAIIPFLDELLDEASQIGAVNVIAFENGKSVGHNTDAFGFHQSIKPFLTNRHERAMILGTGGASKAVEHVLKNLGVDVIYISRNPKNERTFSYEEINEWMLKACKLVVNTTPVGTFPDVDDCPLFPFQYLTEEHLVVDLIYNPAKTKFLEKSEAHGATILNGQSMLAQQALRAWSIWNK